VLAAGGLTAAVAVVGGGATATSASAGGSIAQFEALAQCESGGNWSINTGNGYYGGIQFSAATWRGIGYGGLPHQASKATQIEAGQKLQGLYGWGQWPACSRKLGLSGDGGVSTPTSTAASTHTHAAPAPAPAPAPTRAASHTHAAPAPHAHAAPAPTRAASVRASRSRTAPAFAGGDMTIADISRFSVTTKAWQQQMRSRGWTIAVDGYFGPESSSVAARFAAEKHLHRTAAGTVDATVFKAAWTAPVT
jgi:pyruvate/2-oxoglutarate dehydrogenase complex dihydrolipoamide acyltransferase (E2) component